MEAYNDKKLKEKYAIEKLQKEHIMKMLIIQNHDCYRCTDKAVGACGKICLTCNSSDIFYFCDHLLHIDCAYMSSKDIVSQCCGVDLVEFEI